MLRLHAYMYSCVKHTYAGLTALCVLCVYGRGTNPKPKLHSHKLNCPDNA